MNKGKLAAATWIRLAKCYGLILREVRKGPAESGLTLPQFDALAQLLRNHPDGMTPKELSEAMLVTAGNVTGIVQRLEDQGTVTREPHPTDGRAAILRLTPAGLDLAQQEVDHHERLLSDLFSDVSNEELSSVRAQLDDFRGILEHSFESV